MPSLQSIVSTLSLLAPFAAAQIGPVCEPIIGQANPIATQFTKQTTGTINSTIIIAPIDIATARSIIPAQYPILTKQISAWMPSLPAGQYPVCDIYDEHDIEKNEVANLL